MKWFRRRSRRPKSAPFDASMLPPREPASFETAVSEGVMLAEYAARLRLRNEIIVGAVAESTDYEPRRYLPVARTVMSSLAAEAAAAADRLAEERAEAEELSGKGGHAHDYRAGDVRNLRRRESVSRELAHRLRGFRDDDEYLLGFIERSRDEAWRDISGTLEDNIRRAHIVVDDRYEQERERRQLDLIGDLAALGRVREKEREKEQLESESGNEIGT